MKVPLFNARVVDGRPPFFRAREWLADNFRWAQYPRQQFLPKHPHPPFFKHEMPGWKRAFLLLFGFLAVSFSAVILFFIGLLFWAIVTA